MKLIGLIFLLLIYSTKVYSQTISPGIYEIKSDIEEISLQVNQFGFYQKICSFKKIYGFIQVNNNVNKSIVNFNIDTTTADTGVDSWNNRLIKSGLFKNEDNQKISLFATNLNVANENQIGSLNIFGQDSETKFKINKISCKKDSCSMLILVFFDKKDYKIINLFNTIDNKVLIKIPIKLNLVAN